MADTDGVDAILDQWQRERPDLDTSPIGVIGRISRLCREIERRLEPIFAATLMLTTSGTTKRLDRLEAAGHVTREPDPSDRRGVLIALTAQNRRLIDKAAGQ